MTYTSFPNFVSRRHVLVLLGLAGSSCRTPLRLPGNPVADVLLPMPLADVRLGGSLGRKLDLCIRNRVFAENPEGLVEPFRHREERSCWQTEFWGKWFLSASAACAYTGDHEWRERLRQSAREILDTQTPDGYIGNYAESHRLQAWDVWGRKYTLLGLLAEYDLSNDAACLTGARRLADQLMTEVGPLATDIVSLGLYRGMAASSVLEPMVQLYRQTRDERYLQFAEYIVDRWSTARGPQLVEKALAGVPVGQRFPTPRNWWSWENGEKAYEMMSCYAGLLELYRQTGWAPGLQAASRTFESIRDTEIDIAGSGSAAECWYGGRALQTEPRERSLETCVAVSWMQLCAQLLRSTGDPRYGDEIEKTAYNALAGAMTPDGSSFAQYSSLEGIRSLGPPQCGMDLNCCRANGPRGLMLLPEVAVMMGAQGPAVNLYCSGAWKFRLPSGAECALTVTTDYPKSGAVEILVETEQAASFPLRLRIPKWSRETSATVAGATVGGLRPGSWAAVERRWTSGDRVRLGLDMRGRLVESTASGKRFVAIVRGPVALARDSRLQRDNIDDIVSLKPDAQGDVPLRETTPPAGVETAFVAPGGPVFCDYASAGNTWNDKSRFRTWLPT